MDVVIVGGGVGGSALGAALAEAGLAVGILERTTEFEDRVRGEWMAPWGVAEAKRLGLYEALVASGGHHLSRHIPYDESLDPSVAETRVIPIAMIHPDSPGPLCLEHTRIQETLLERAFRVGAQVRRGVSDVQVEAGAGRAGRVRFRHDGDERELGCRLVVGADGRSSTVRRQLGVALEEAPVDHLIAGLLIDGAEGWPDDLQAMGKVGDINYLVFPQGRGKIRLYADYDVAGRGRFSGSDGARRLLEAFDMACVPRSRAIAEARPIGPCRSYPSQDAWSERPFGEGFVLMGDAAGYNDPILGQGLSITLRDARMLRDALSDGTHWGVSSFAPYAEERRERLRRLRFSARVITQLYARFDADSLARRTRAFERLFDPAAIAGALIAPYLGPELVDADAFSEDTFARLFA